MTPRVRIAGTFGVLLMASSAALPWAKTGPTFHAIHPVSGVGNGLEVVLLLAAVSALALLIANRPIALLAACGAAAWTALVMYQLPGSLVASGGIGIASMSWGAYLALAGSSILAAAASWPRASQRPDRATLA